MKASGCEKTKPAPRPKLLEKNTVGGAVPEVLHPPGRGGEGINSRRECLMLPPPPGRLLKPGGGRRALHRIGSGVRTGGEVRGRVSGMQQPLARSTEV